MAVLVLGLLFILLLAPILYDWLSSVSAVNSKSVGKSSSLFCCVLENVVECGIGIDSAGGADGVGADGSNDEAIFVFYRIFVFVCFLSFVLIVWAIVVVVVVVASLINQYQGVICVLSAHKILN